MALKHNFKINMRKFGDSEKRNVFYLSSSWQASWESYISLFNCWSILH